VCHWNYYTIAHSNLLPVSISGIPVVEASWQYHSFINTSASGIVQCFVCHSISVFRFDLLHRRKFTHAHVCVNIECNFSAKSFYLKNLSSLTNFRKLSAVSNTVSIVHFSLKDVMPVLITITYCRDGQSVWLEGHFEKRPRLADRETDLFAGTDLIAPDVLFKTTNAGAPKTHRGYPDMYPSGGLAPALPSNLSVK